MKSKLWIGLACLGLWIASPSASIAQSRQSAGEVKVEFNERQLEKHLDQYADQLDLSRRQQRKITRIKKKYGKKEENLAEEKGLKLGKKRALQKQKAEALLSVLNDQQIEKLNTLAGRKGLFKKVG
jgi:hypothetical protein